MRVSWHFGGDSVLLQANSARVVLRRLKVPSKGGLVSEHSMQEVVEQTIFCEVCEERRTLAGEKHLSVTCNGALLQDFGFGWLAKTLLLLMRSSIALTPHPLMRTPQQLSSLQRLLACKQPSQQTQLARSLLGNNRKLTGGELSRRKRHRRNLSYTLGITSVELGTM